MKKWKQNPITIPPDQIVMMKRRIRRHSELMLSGCWEWKLARNSQGYGNTTCAGQRGGAHRFSYATFKGPVPRNTVVRHKCDNPPCVNPDHLEIGSQLENALDCVKRGRHVLGTKTHCPKGHPYSGKNLGLSKQYGRGTWNRTCRQCHRDRQAMRNKRKRVPNICVAHGSENK